MEKKIIYLNGFMASGKSTIGPILANTLGWNFYDLDKVIELDLGMTIVNIFEQKGESYFRQVESQTLCRLSKLENSVISLGGGTSSYNDNIKIIRSTGKVVYLKASQESLYKRLRNKSDRPMINRNTEGDSKDDLNEKINKLLKLRTPYYEQADLIINTDDYPIGITVDKLTKLIIKKVYEKN